MRARRRRPDPFCRAELARSLRRCRASTGWPARRPPRSAEPNAPRARSSQPNGASHDAPVTAVRRTDVYWNSATRPPRPRARRIPLRRPPSRQAPRLHPRRLKLRQHQRQLQRQAQTRDALLPHGTGLPDPRHTQDFGPRDDALPFVQLGRPPRVRRVCVERRLARHRIPVHLERAAI